MSKYSVVLTTVPGQPSGPNTVRAECYETKELENLQAASITPPIILEGGDTPETAYNILQKYAAENLKDYDQDFTWD